MEGSDGGIAAATKGWIALGAAAVALVAAVVALDQDWFERSKSRACSMSGTVATTFTGSPAPGVQVGFVTTEGTPSFVRLLRSDAAGNFSGSCETARRYTSGADFELWAVGNFRGGVLPVPAFAGAHRRDRGWRRGVEGAEP
jgi:hypothetical protein